MAAEAVDMHSKVNYNVYFNIIYLPIFGFIIQLENS